MPFTDHERQCLEYAAGHLAGSINHPEDPHAGDSADLAWEVFEEVFEARVLRSLGVREASS